MRRFKVLPPLGLATVVVAALFAVLQALRDMDTPIAAGQATSALQAETAPAAEAPGVTVPPETLLPDTVFQERPLLIEGRRALEPAVAIPEPPPPVAEPETTPEPEPIGVETAPPMALQIELVGVAIIGSDKSALIRFSTDGAERWLRPGDMVGPWMLAEITQEAARFEAGGTEITLSLFAETLP